MHSIIYHEPELDFQTPLYTGSSARTISEVAVQIMTAITENNIYILTGPR